MPSRHVTLNRLSRLYKLNLISTFVHVEFDVKIPENVTDDMLHDKEYPLQSQNSVSQSQSPVSHSISSLTQSI